MANEFLMSSGNSFGGIKEILVIRHEFLGELSITNGVISGIATVGGRTFRRYLLPNDNRDFWKESLRWKRRYGLSYREQELHLSLQTLSTELRQEILTLCEFPLAMIVCDRNSRYWLLGEKNGMDLADTGNGTGMERGDFNGGILLFRGMEENPSMEVVSGF